MGWSQLVQFLINPMTTLGDLIYGGASGVATRLAGNTTATQQFLAQTGTGSASAAPQWVDAPTPIYPQRATLWFDEYTPVDIFGAAVYNLNASQPYGLYITPTSTPAFPAIGVFSLGFFLAAGTYTLSILGTTNSNYGIIKWYLETFLSGSPVATDDWYSASQTFEVVHSYSITLADDGYHVLYGLIYTKNASSSGYSFGLTKAWIAPATDTPDVD